MFPIAFDTSSLTYPMFLIPGIDTDFHNGAFAPTLQLPAGIYSFQQASGYFADFQFEVTPEGTVDYAGTLDATEGGFLSGKGGATLKVNGFPVELDGTALSHGLVPMIAGSLSFLLPDTVHSLVLLPASHYGFYATSGVVAEFEFRVNLEGKVEIDPAFAGFAEVEGSHRLVLHGYPIQIDGRRLTNDLVPLLDPATPLSRAIVNTLTLLPGAGYGLQPGSGLVADSWFEVTLDGTLQYSPSYDGFLEGRGSSTLTIFGYPVVVDARHADDELASLVDTGQRAQTPYMLFGVLLPCDRYRLQTLTASSDGIFTHTFRLSSNGTVTVDPSPVPGMVVSSAPAVGISGPTPI